LEEQVAEREDENKRAQQTIAILEKEREDLEKRLKILRDESKQTETKLKRESDISLIRCKETISELEATIVGLKS
jgi:3-phenylpropionate/cinnamic acid dioxygenase small subunit